MYALLIRREGSDGHTARSRHQLSMMVHSLSVHMHLVKQLCAIAGWLWGPRGAESRIHCFGRSSTGITGLDAMVGLRCTTNTRQLRCDAVVQWCSGAVVQWCRLGAGHRKEFLAQGLRTAVAERVFKLGLCVAPESTRSQITLAARVG
jgi:hypothetical protein